MKDFENLLTAKQCCEFLGISGETLYTLCRTGRIPYLRIRHRYRFEREKVLQALCESNNTLES